MHEIPPDGAPEDLTSHMPDGLDTELSELMDQEYSYDLAEYDALIAECLGEVFTVLASHNLIPDGFQVETVTASVLTDLRNDPEIGTAVFANRVSVLLYDLLAHKEFGSYGLAEMTDPEDEYLRSLQDEADYKLIATLVKGDNPEQWLKAAEAIRGYLPLPSDPAKRFERIRAIVELEEMASERGQVEDEIMFVAKDYLRRSLLDVCGEHDDLEELIRNIFWLGQHYAQEPRVQDLARAVEPMEDILVMEIQGVNSRVGVDGEVLSDLVSWVALYLHVGN